MSKIDEIKKALQENTEEWARAANRVIDASDALKADEAKETSLATDTEESCKS